MLSVENSDASEHVVKEDDDTLNISQTKKKAIFEKLQQGKKNINKQDTKTAKKDSTSNSDW